MIRRVAAGIGMTTFDKLVIAGTQLTLVPVLASRWGLDLYGQWLLLATLPQFLSMSDFGFATAAGTRMTMAAARGDRAEALRLFQSAWRAILASSAAILTVLLALAWLLPASALGELRTTFAVLAVYGVLAVQGGIVSAGLRAAGLFPIAAFWNAMVLLIENGALVATVLLGGGPLAAACAWLLGRMLGLAGQAILLRCRVPWLHLGLAQGNWREARALAAPAGAVMLLPAAQALVLQGTALMVGAAAGQAAVPAFAAVRTLSRVGMQMCWIVSTPLMPELSAVFARGERRRVAQIVAATLLFSGLLVVPFGLGFIIAGRWAVALWTDGAIVPAPGLVAAMGLTVVLGGVWYPLSNLILACGRQARYTVWYLGLALVGVPLAYGLATRWGATGSAVAMVAVDAAMLVVVARAARRYLASGGELAEVIVGWARGIGRVRRPQALP